jgi:MerR family transcriptional regulator/heat shock protein HspR
MTVATGVAAEFPTDAGLPVADPDDLPLYVISVAARLAAMHPQTLRQYDRLGLVVPGRARGRGRRYSRRVVEALREVQRLSAIEGVNLAGIKRVLELEAENRALRRLIEQLKARVETDRRFFAVGPHGETTAFPRGQRPARPDRPVSTPGPDTAAGTARAIVVWQPLRPPPPQGGRPQAGH